MSTAEITTAALALPRSARLRLASALMAKDGALERAADLEALARSAEMDEAPAQFTAKGSHSQFISKLRAGLYRKGSKKKAAALA